MMRILLLLSNLLALVLGQGTQLPDSTTPSSPAITDCGGCVVIADIAAVVFGESQILETATQLVSVGVGKNGTRVTTEFVQPIGAFSFNTGGLIPASATAGEIQFGGTIFTISGVALTSPTAYNVFTAYTVTSTFPSGGQCITSTDPVVAVSPAFSVAVPESPDVQFILEAESSFIANVGLPSCAAGGVGVIAPTTVVPIGTTTVGQTVTGILRPTPQGRSSAASAIVTALPETTAAATTTFTEVVTMTNSTASLIIAGTGTSIIVGSGPSITVLPFSEASMAVFLPNSLFVWILLALPGALAWVL